MAAIREIEPIGVSIPLRKPVKLASEVVAAADNLVVRVMDSDGLVGWGESASAPTMTGERLGGMVAAVRERIAPSLLGRDVEARPDWVSTLAGMAGDPGARSAVEVALHDLLARRRGVSVAALLGTEPRAVAVIRTVEAEIGAEAVAALLADGVTHIKVKVGMAAPAEDARALCALRAAIGPDRHLSADANMAWSLDEATAFVDAAAEAALDYLEQPLAADDVAGMATLASRTAIPLCLDEALHGVSDMARYAEARAARGVGLKLLKLGGFLGAAAAEEEARRLGWRTTWASKIAESSLGAAATLHATGFAADLSWGVSLTHDRLVGDLVGDPLRAEGGLARAPQGPGLGVIPDPDLLARYRVDQ
ncbi:mandelate racemase/muconate lactonizing enzyme family protein [Acuticoccus kandeliae]|uniref:mandelate racemase/muconate lactonizing enzyme family protein n=1 Tax=Acuticoccus kandeliae TaxID=2073160 RepID=UPI00147624E0|nr:mandelate racemase/muconate lactonizing enzyme family protein [Acuticoccus kandeliae]